MARSRSLAILKVQLWCSCLNLFSWSPCSKHCLPVFQNKTVACFLILQENSTVHSQHLPCWPPTTLLSILSTKQTLSTYLIHKLFLHSKLTNTGQIQVGDPCFLFCHPLQSPETWSFQHIGMSPERVCAAQHHEAPNITGISEYF